MWLIRWGRGSKKKVNGKTDIIRQNENLFLKKIKEIYRIINLFTHDRKLVPDSKMRINTFIWGLMPRGLIWSNTRVKKKVGLAVGWGSLHVYAEKYDTYSKGCQASSVQMFQ